MNLKVKLPEKTYVFHDLREVMAKASDEKSGDKLAGIAAEDAVERVAAKMVLSELTVHDITENPAVPYEKDAVTRIIIDDLDRAAYHRIENMTIAELREWLLNDHVDSEAMLSAGRGMTSEVIAAVCKLMGNLDLIYAGSKMRILATCNTTIGEQNVLASRLQPNHPVDDPDGVRASIYEGLSYGVGDAVIGLNPALDTVEGTVRIWDAMREIKEKLEIPTQTCVLSHITTQMDALATGAKADLCFNLLRVQKKVWLLSV